MHALVWFSDWVSQDSVDDVSTDYLRRLVVHFYIGHRYYSLYNIFYMHLSNFSLCLYVFPMSLCLCTIYHNWPLMHRTFLRTSSRWPHFIHKNSYHYRTNYTTQGLAVVNFLLHINMLSIKRHLTHKLACKNDC